MQLQQQLLVLTSLQAFVVIVVVAVVVWCCQRALAAVSATHHCRARGSRSASTFLQVVCYVWVPCHLLMVLSTVVPLRFFLKPCQCGMV